MMGILGLLFFSAGCVCFWVGLLNADYGYLLPFAFILAAIGIILLLIGSSASGIRHRRGGGYRSGKNSDSGGWSWYSSGDFGNDGGSCGGGGSSGSGSSSGCGGGGD